MTPQLFRQFQRPTSWLGSLCLNGVVSYSTVPHDEDLFQHIQFNNQIFPQPNPKVLYVPDGFPFYVDKIGPMPHDLCLKRSYRQDTIYMKVNKFNSGRIPSLQTNGVIYNYPQNMKFRMEAQPDDVRLNFLSIRDMRGRHVEGSEKYLEAKDIKPSTIRILFDYLRDRVIPRQDEFPFEVKDGLSRGSLTLRRKHEDEIIMVKVRAIDVKRILDEQVKLEARYKFKHWYDEMDELDQYDFKDWMNVFKDEQVENVEKIGDIGCLLMSVCTYYGYHYSKCIKLEIFALPDQIVVPEISLSDNGCNGLEAFDTYFKDRGLHSGTMNFIIESIVRLTAEHMYSVKAEPVPKIFGRYDESQWEAATCRAVERYNRETGRDITYQLLKYF